MAREGRTAVKQEWEKPPRRRRRLLVDPRWQLRNWRLTASAALAAGVGHVIICLGLLGGTTLEDLSGEQIGLLALAVNFLFFVLLAGALYFVTVRLTHAVAGPAQVLTRAVEGLQQGDYHRRTRLRDADYLQDLAAAVSRLSRKLAEEAEAERRFFAALAAVMDPAAVEQVRELAARSGLRVPAADPTPVSEACT